MGIRLTVERAGSGGRAGLRACVFLVVRPDKFLQPLCFGFIVCAAGRVVKHSLQGCQCHGEEGGAVPGVPLQPSAGNRGSGQLTAVLPMGHCPGQQGAALLRAMLPSDGQIILGYKGQATTT